MRLSFFILDMTQRYIQSFLLIVISWDPLCCRYGTKTMASASSSPSLSSSSPSKPSVDISSSGGLGFHAGSNTNVRQELSEFCHLPASDSSASISSMSSMDSSSLVSRGSVPTQHPSSDPMEHTDITSMGPDSMIKKQRKEKKPSGLKNILNRFKNSGSSNNTSSHCWWWSPPVGFWLIRTGVLHELNPDTGRQKLYAPGHAVSGLKGNHFYLTWCSWDLFFIIVSYLFCSQNVCVCVS